MDVSMSHLRVFTDGGSRGNPGPSAAGVYFPDTRLRLGVFLGNDHSNNTAEYWGLLTALSYVIPKGYTDVEFYADSQLMVKQMLGEYKVNSPNIAPLWRKARCVADQLTNVSYFHVRRVFNKEADAIVNEVLDSVEAGEGKFECYRPKILS